MATGALALVALETVLQPQASGRLGNLLALPAGWANRFLDPAVPALHKGTPPSHPHRHGRGGRGLDQRRCWRGLGTEPGTSTGTAPSSTPNQLRAGTSWAKRFSGTAS